MKNAYVEITNICNLSCSFCPGHTRNRRSMTAEEFRIVASKLEGRIQNLFLHIMGEPLIHSELDKILDIAGKIGADIKITTNGTLLPEKVALLSKTEALKTVCISLHSFEGNAIGGMAELKLKKYLSGCIDAGKKLARKGKFVVYRLWNLDDEGKGKAKSSFNDFILKELETAFSPEREEWVKTHCGQRIATHVFIEWGEYFDWPGTDCDKTDCCSQKEYEGEYGSDFCHGLLTQIGILSDGTVVPCCMDRNGDIPLGNIFESDLDEILMGDRARNMREAMAHHRFIEPLCHSCGFIRL